MSRWNEIATRHPNGEKAIFFLRRGGRIASEIYSSQPPQLGENEECSIRVILKANEVQYDVQTSFAIVKEFVPLPIDPAGIHA